MVGSVVFPPGFCRFGLENSWLFLPDSTGSVTEPVWNCSGWLRFSWNSLRLKGTGGTIGRKIEDFTGTF